jgi:ABC-type bacteriocin/lantibiotic exporter with double-glycine peptidase domain
VYYGYKVSEEELIQQAGTCSGQGTLIKDIEKTLGYYDLKFDSKKMTEMEVRNYLDQGFPVLLLLQAWNGGNIDYKKDYQDGHWVVAIGYQEDRIIFEDPYAFERTFLTREELKERWYSQEKDQKINQQGIVVLGIAQYDSKEIIHME